MIVARAAWGEDRLTFELAPAQDGAACRLSFSVGLDGADKAARDAAGWDQCLDMLDLVVAGGHPARPPAADGWRDAKDYRRNGLPATAPILEP